MYESISHILFRFKDTNIYISFKCSETDGLFHGLDFNFLEPTRCWEKIVVTERDSFKLCSLKAFL